MLWHKVRDFSGSAALFLDRDGVINEKIENGYVLDYDRDFRFIRDFATCARRFTEADIPLIVISNQSCVDRNKISRRELGVLMHRMIGDLRAEHVNICGYVICPHLPEAGCTCRKPAAGLLHRAAAFFGLRLWDCPFIGDSVTDMEAALAAGSPGLLVNPREPRQYRETFRDALHYMTARMAA